MPFVASKGWTWDRQRYLIAHSQDGVGLLSEALGASEDEVIRHAEKSGLRLSYGPEYGELNLCPFCCERFVRPQTNSGRAGACPTCWERFKSESRREAKSWANARREYEDAKKQAQRAKRGAGKAV